MRLRMKAEPRLREYSLHRDVRLRVVGEAGDALFIVDVMLVARPSSSTSPFHAKAALGCSNL